MSAPSEIVILDLTNWGMIKRSNFRRLKVPFLGGQNNNQEIESHIFQEVKSFINICDYFSGDHNFLQHFVGD
jgi:hypothetical protein